MLVIEKNKKTMLLILLNIEIKRIRNCCKSIIYSKTTDILSYDEIQNTVNSYVGQMQGHEYSVSESVGSSSALI